MTGFTGVKQVVALVRPGLAVMTHCTKFVTYFVRNVHIIMLLELSTINCSRHYMQKVSQGSDTSMFEHRTLRCSSGKRRQIRPEDDDNFATSDLWGD